jgi:hypothetical protein
VSNAKYVTPSTLGRFFSVSGNKLKSLHAKLLRSNDIIIDENTGISYYSLNAVLQHVTPKTDLPESAISVRAS